MKLKELLDDVFKDGPIEQENNYVSDYCLYGKKYLETIKEKILQCEEFSECTELTILDHPIYENDGEVCQVQSFRLGEGQKFGGKGFLLSLSLSPEIYNPETIHNSVKDGACITPLYFNHENFEPYKKIVLQFNTEKVQDDIINHEFVVRKELHDLLDKVLDNPQDYQIKGERHVLVRGVFETNEIRTPVHPPQYLTGVNPNPDTHTIVYYLDKKNNKEGEINMTLKTKLIPKELKEKFIEEFGIKGIEVTEEEINDFLENQGINRYTGRLGEILKKSKEVEDRISKVEKYHEKVKKNRNI